VFGFVLAAVVATILLAGLAPALRAAATDPTEPMKEGSGTTTGRIRDRYNPLVVVEVALSTALLMASALFLIFVARLAAFEWQYAAKRIVTAEITTGRKQNLPDRAGVERFFDDLVARSARLPGAVAAATRRTDVVEGPTVFGEQGKSGLRWMNLRSFSVVSPDYLRTLGVPVLDGRDFEAADRSSATGVAIVDEAAARRLWPDMPTPVGRMIKLGKLESPGPWLRVVGVARSMEPGPRPDYLLPPEPMIYVVIGHDRVDRRQLLVRGDGAGGDRGRAALALTVQHDLAAAAPWLGATRVAPLLEQYEQVRTQSSFMASIFGAFGAFGLALCAVGLYAVLAYTVNRRLREFAVRIALGAARRDVARLVIRDAAVMALGGVGVGAFVALWLTRSISDVLSARGYADAFALVLAEAVIFAVAFVASLGPVGRATRADPMEILRAG
jgi:predicted permease